jgi:hypothetical protein
MLSEEKWQKISWRRDHGSRDEVWFVGERRSTGEQNYYVSNLPDHAMLKALAATIKVRWIREQAHQQPNKSLGSTTWKANLGSDYIDTL